MKRLIRYLYLIIGCIIFNACGGGSDGGGGGEGPVVSKDYLNVTSELQLLGSGEERDISISANCSWTITIETGADWLTVNPTSGNNSQTVKVSTGENPTNQERIAVLSVQGGTLPAKKITVTQLVAPAEEPTLSTDISSLNFDKNGGNKNFIITSNVDWSITCPDWCSPSTISGKDNATITVSVGENPTMEQRTGQLIIKGDGVDDVTISITQEAGDKNINEPGADDNQPPSPN